MQELWKNQRENLFLYVPFIMAAGAALYFTMATEPNIPYCWLVAAVTFVAAILIRIPVIRAILLFIFGFTFANTYTNILDTPTITRDLQDVNVHGRVEQIDYTTNRARIFIRVPARELKIKSDDDTIIRVSISADQLPNINDEITTSATLFQPNTPDIWGGFDFARWAYFNGIGATGFIDDFQITHHATIGTTNNIRDWLHTRAESKLVDGLVLGYKNSLPADERNTWVAAGVGHIWSISGFHMTLVVGWLFAIFYFLFRCIPFIVRRIPARNMAFIFAWIGVMMYLGLSGMGVATTRAFLMTTLLLAAAIMGRSAFSLRNVCMVFCIIFLANPYYIMTAGFQLSFSAIFGLIWFWTIIKPRVPQNKILRAIYTAILTAIVASTFTAPFVAMHFYSLPLYSILGNLILLPIFSFVIMPLVMLGTICAAVGIHFPLHIADIIYNWTLGIANQISLLPFATVTTGAVSNTAICFFIVGMMAIVFIKPVKLHINYIIGAAFIFIGTITAYFAPMPIFFATPDHELVGTVKNDEIIFNKIRASNHYFIFDTWKQMTGHTVDTPHIRATHERGLYIFETQKYKIAYMQRFLPLLRNLVKLCNDDSVDYIVSYMNIRAPACEHKILQGGFTIYDSGKIIYLPATHRWNNRH
ncbi:MAG: ComEC/Rec2 family competence protein [Alphaproteobacteria bacterium]|nr:ComEC/Rec2 family competence protein [Alphaproteobacteria bacterium]